MGILTYKGFPTKSISAVEDLASTALVLGFLALGVFGIAEFGGFFDVGEMLLSWRSPHELPQTRTSPLY